MENRAETSRLSRSTEAEREIMENKEHYAYQVQLLIDFYNAGQLPEVESITVESRYGYVASILYTNGNRRVVYGRDS